MIFEKKTEEAIFLQRPNRFQAWVDLGGEKMMVHVPNTGRLKEILIPGCRCVIRHEDGIKRKTAYSLIAAWKDGILINFDSQIPNRVVEEALLARRIPLYSDFDLVEREKNFGSSRFDFRLTRGNEPVYYLEVKGVTLEKDEVVSFPDAVTERGARHLRELVQAKLAGFGAGLIFLIQLEKARYFTPNTSMDPRFTEALEYALKSGVDIQAFTCDITPTSLALGHPVPILIQGE